MTKNRLEAFSDGVLAIIITIMVLELKVPHGTELKDLAPLYPYFSSYVLSFIYLGIYWNNHHHMLHTVKNVSGGILWANMHLLFWLSLVPFTTGWMAENHFAPLTLTLYGVDLLMAAIAYFILQRMILKLHGSESLLKKAIGNDLKGKASLILYIAAIVLSYFDISQLAAGGIYVLVALIWLVPDKRIEKTIYGTHKE